MFVLGSLGALGACIGSFLNVVAYRLPRECMSISRPRSRCTRCAQPIAWFENLPILSWLLLRGRCRHCGVRISVRYPLVEIGVALLFVALGLIALEPEARSSLGEYTPQWLTWGVLALITSALVALSLIDLDFRILPDEITKSGIVVGPVLAFMAPSVQHGRYLVPVGESLGEWAPRVNAFVNGLLGIVLAGGVLWLVGWLGTKAFKKDAMGFGDVKMIAAMGGVLGAWALLSLAVAAVVGAVVGLIVRLATRSRYIPFGPFLAMGMWVVMLWGPEIFAFYLGIFSPRGVIGC